MRQAVELVGILNLVLFAAIAVVCVRQWSRERAPTALWAALAFVSLAAVIVVGKLLPDEPQGFAEKALQRFDLAVPGALPVSPLSLRGGVRVDEAPARPVRRCAHHRTRRRNLCPASSAWEGRLVAVVVHRVRRRLHHSLVGAAADRVGAPVARGPFGGIRRAPADGDARGRCDCDHRRPRARRGGRRRRTRCSRW